MSNLMKLEIKALDITGKNYLSWMLDVKLHLDAKALGETIKENNTTSSQDKAKAMIFLRHHLNGGLKVEYLTVKDPQVLWKNLKDTRKRHNIVKKRYNIDDDKIEKNRNENVTNICYRCGGKGNWSRVCRTPKHLVDLYQQSIKRKGKKVETNLVYEDRDDDFDIENTTYLEVADFFTAPKENN
ncbi:uncharacterized protein LOC141645843 [Silene latifolia]|uniref:uncharacterized protein LOC141645843 n=1 Tax=Silene latifolia TaxID=37657 RepID=UPI003D770B7B